MGRSFIGSWLGFEPGDADEGPEGPDDDECDGGGGARDDRCDDGFEKCGCCCCFEKAEVRCGL